MTETERLVTNKLMSFGILPDVNNLEKIKELIELVKNEETEQLTLTDVVVAKRTLFCTGCKSANIKTHIEEYFECLDCGREFTK
jgi:hypothetical protein